MDHKTSQKKYHRVREGGRGNSLAKGWIKSNKSAFPSPLSRELVTPSVRRLKVVR